MSSFQTLLNTVDQYDKDLVCGFIRESAKKYSLDLAIFVYFLPLQYYFIKEFFAIYGQGLLVTNQNNTILSCKLSSHLNHEMNEYKYSAFGNAIIDNTDTSITEYIWKLKILNGLKSAIIGIDSNHHSFKSINSNFALSATQNNLYSFSTSTDNNKRCIIITYDGNHRSYRYAQVENELKSGDTIMMVVNVRNKTLRVYLNGYEWGVFIDNIIFDRDRKYSLAISCCPSNKTNGDCIEMAEFISI